MRAVARRQGPAWLSTGFEPLGESLWYAIGRLMAREPPRLGLWDVSARLTPRDAAPETEGSPGRPLTGVRPMRVGPTPIQHVPRP